MRKLLLFAALCLPHVHLMGTTYSVSTNNKDISCTLKTLSQMKMLKLIGDYGDPVARRYMGVEVQIENNTLHTIVLDKDEYLRGVAKAFVPKETILTSLINDNNDVWWLTIMMAGGASLSTLLPLTMMVDEFSRKRAANWPSVLMTGGLALFTAAAAAGCIYGAYNASETIKKATAKRDSLADLTCHYAGNRRAVSHYSPNVHRYKIRPGQTFKDMIFINLKRVDRDFFDLVTPRLDYSTKKRG